MSDKIIPSMASGFVSGVAKTTGWSSDFTSDISGAVGAGGLAFAGLGFLTGSVALLMNPFLWIMFAGGAASTALVWRRNRRDNT